MSRVYDTSTTFVYYTSSHSYAIHSLTMSLKRSITNDNANEKKFQLDKQGDACLYITVSQFRGDIYIHIRKYFKENPTKFGFWFKPEERWRIAKHLQTTGVTRSSTLHNPSTPPLLHNCASALAPTLHPVPLMNCLCFIICYTIILF